MVYKTGDNLNLLGAVVLGASVLAGAANATILTIYDGVAAGASNFDSTVTAAGGTGTTDVWTGLSSGYSISRPGYTVTKNDGGWLSPYGYGTLSGQVVDIDPALNPGASEPSGGRAAPGDYFLSGLTFTFDNAINAIGFEVGDWATCCHDPVTELFISFDGGAPILVGSADEEADGEFPSQDNPSWLVNEIFVAAFDDTGSFTTVSFWGNGLGEVLNAGGQIKYALLDEGSLPSEVPLPAGGLLLLSGLGVAGALRLRRRTTH